VLELVQSVESIAPRMLFLIGLSCRVLIGS
jgi:hypothetical protein